MLKSCDWLGKAGLTKGLLELQLQAQQGWTDHSALPEGPVRGPIIGSWCILQQGEPEKSGVIGGAGLCWGHLQTQISLYSYP